MGGSCRPRLVLERLRSCLDCTFSSLYIHEEEHHVLTLAERRGASDHVVAQDESLPLGGGTMVGRAAATREVQIIDDASAPPADLVGDTMLGERARGGAALALPLLFGGRLLGVLGVVASLPGPVSPPARAKLAALARFAAVALAEAASRRVSGSLSTQLRQAHQAGQAVIDAMSVVPEQQLRTAVRRGFYIWPQCREAAVPEFIAEVIQRVVEQARALVGAEIAALGIGDLPERRFEPWAMSGVAAAVMEAVGHPPRPVGTLGVVACEGKIVRVANVKSHPSFRGLPEHHPPVSSLLGVPIRYRGVALGNLYLANKVGAEEFSVQDQEAIEALANQTAVALQHAFMQASIEGQRAQTQSLLDSAPHGILFIDGHTKGVMANPSAMRLLGETISPDAGVEQYVERLRTPDGRPVKPEATPGLRALRGEEHPTEHFLVVRRDGTEIAVLESAAPVRGFGDKIIGAVVNFEDVSRVRDLERLQNLERVRQEFNAMVAHDLRNPIQTVLAQIYMLLGQAQGDEVKVPVKALQRIERSARRLGQMTQMLIDAARVELQAIKLQRKPAHLPDVVSALIDRLRPGLGEHAIELSVEGRVPMVGLDPLAFEQALTNLIDNAAKFSLPAAPIQVLVRAGEGGVTVSVRDQGIGIDAERLAHLFDRFYHVQHARERKSGLGLGLFIAKGYVDAHGGRITVESEVGHGSTFHVWFPTEERA